jgi:hypothetical protein
MRLAIERMLEFEGGADAATRGRRLYTRSTSTSTAIRCGRPLRVSRRVTNLKGKSPKATRAQRRLCQALVAREPETAL